MLEPWDRDAVDQLFDTLQFRALRERLDKVRPSGPADEVGGPQPEQAETAVVEPVAAAAAAWLAAGTGVSSVAVAGLWARGTGHLDSVAVLDDRDEIAVLDCADAATATVVLDWLADAGAAKDLHDAKGPALAVLASGRELRGLRIDTALAAYVDSPGHRGYSLPDVSERVLGITLGEAAGTEQALFDTGEGTVRQLAAQASAVRGIARALEPRLSEQGSMTLLAEVEVPLVPLLAKMEHAGIAVDLPGLRALSDEFGADMRRSEEEAHAHRGTTLQPRVAKQLQEILFGERNLPKTKKIKTGYTTDAEALQQLFAQTQDPLLEQLLGWRDRSRLRQTVDGLIPLADADGRIHTSFNQMVAATGRLSCSDPNLQNIPIRTDEGRRIRRLLRGRGSHDVLLTADYSQIELRFLAHLSEETALIDAFLSDEDVHPTVAAEVFGVPATASRRRDAPPHQGDVVRPRIRPLAPTGSACSSGITPEEANGLMTDYFTRFGEIRDYLHEVVERARVAGTRKQCSADAATCPTSPATIRQRREMAERMALNAPIQGSAADIIKIAMMRVQSALERTGLRSRLVLQVHDELVVEIGPGERDVGRGSRSLGDGRRSRPVGAAGRLGGVRGHLAGCRPLGAL